MILRLVSFLTLSALLCACSFDLFHSTDWPTVCDLDPTTSGCSRPNQDAAVDAADSETSLAPDSEGGASEAASEASESSSSSD